MFRRHPKLTDWDVLKVYESLIKLYRAEATNYPTPVFSLSSLSQELFDFVKSMGELSLGRGAPLDEKDKSVEIPITPITVEELIQCLKRLRRSVEMWNKENGRQGYLNFIVDFFER